jgi:LuxR family maltose regulon positive regulatory protein
MAQVRAAAGDLQTAMSLLDRAQALYRPGFYPDIRPIAAMKARLQIAAGDLGPATEWVHHRGLTADDAADYLGEYAQLTLARLLLAQHRAGDDDSHLGAASPLTTALGLLDRLLVAATDAKRAGSLLEIRVLQALAHHARGDLPQALDALSVAWEEAPEPDQYVRLYLDEGAPMQALLNDASSADPAVAPAAGGGHPETVLGQARRLLQRANPPVGGPASQQTLVDPLSQRELEVLRLLATELTGPQIARELYVSLNTLRTHTKRIFTKLEVKTRVAAVRKGQEQGLI